ncbi:hypothetical protein BKA69DRAFT_378797 [Paraphysoderma sedebokerense]|nr:hypothetical protein BKA69DRAFT_378797 [Paraphysoderma sedebokerense]
MSIKSVIIVALLALSSASALPQIDLSKGFPQGFPTGGGSNDATAVAGPGESVTVINDNGKTTTHRGGSGQGIPNFPQGGIPGMPTGGFPGMPKFPGFSGFSASDTEKEFKSNSNDATAVAGPGESVTVINNNGKTTTRRGGSGQGIPNFSRGGIPGMPKGGIPSMPNIPGFSGFSTSDTEE